MDTERGSGVRPKRSRIVELYTNPPPDSTVVCVDELGPVTPRFFPPAPGWSPDGHRIKAPLQYSRGPDKAWVFGALRVEDGKSLTFTSRSRNSKGYVKLLKKIERAIPKGIIHVIADNLKTHKSVMVREWLEDHPRIEHAFIPKGAAWPNLIEAWWRMFRRQALAGQDFADSYEIGQATRVATRQLNRKAKPWVWGRPPKPPRHRRRTFVYRFEERCTNGGLLERDETSESSETPRLESHERASIRPEIAALRAIAKRSLRN